MIIGVWRRLVVVGVLLSIILVVGLDVAARITAANAAGGSGALAVVAYSGEEDDIEGVVTSADKLEICGLRCWLEKIRDALRWAACQACRGADIISRLLHQPEIDCSPVC